MRTRIVLPFLAIVLAACASSPATTPPPRPAPAPPPATQPATPPPATPAPAPAITEAPDAWQSMDLDDDGVPGTSATRAVRDLLAGRQPARTILVAVIDGGVDTAHVDLKDALWRNPDETPGNGMDDDGNGYVDDIFGWNFIGGADGQNVNFETFEVTRLHAQCQNGGALPSGIQCADVAAKFQERRTQVDQTLAQISQIDAALQFALPVLRRAVGTQELTIENVRAIQSAQQDVQQAKNIYLQLDAAGITPKLIADAKEEFAAQAEYGLNTSYETRSIVGDDFADGEERVYGNRDVMGPDAAHGTHVAGIIAAARGNNIGMDGIASPNVRIMAVRAVPNGDERDKDVANAIRYAVDNGAQIVNMSFGKSFSPRKELVDAAVKYAEERGVLLIHAAGNDGQDLEVEGNFPTRDYQGGGRAANWIEVGASNWKADSLAGSFSNFGQTKVDVFAPGVNILSTVPGGGFEQKDGTSMAAPVVTGVAALLMAYFPDLDAADVKRILLESSVKYGDQLVAPPGAPAAPVRFGTLSVTGGVVNAYAAVQMALNGR